MATRFDGFWLRTPFTSCIIGPSKSGKTVLTDKLVQSWDWISCGTKLERFMLLYDCWQPIYEQILGQVPDGVEVILKQGFPMEELHSDKLFKTSGKATLIIIDDLSTTMENSKDVRQAISRLFRVLSHHRYNIWYIKELSAHITFLGT